MDDKRKIDYNVTWEQMTEKQWERFKQFVETTMLLSDKQLNCLSGDEEMTYKIFIECLTVCIFAGNGDKEEFANICEQYPLFFERFCEELDEIEKHYKNNYI